ncbi:hypothetical protein PVAND_012813 [Polypedilum vanderplanki]|uniref:NTR domain-containing protein n=1 Tax=Polypedilum vanderplanki TaxID=319348 RepID=A0A9J6CPJ1_POLVA|nr:hypothetical protein PVAND_012813 [Polypedilum vanderplanki]
MAKVIAREAVATTTKSNEDQSKSESVKFTLQVKAIFRKTDDSVVSNLPKKQNISMYVFTRDLDCKCPKIKVKKSYLILGSDDEGPANALGIGENSIVIEWRDEWYRRLRKYQRQTCD